RVATILFLKILRPNHVPLFHTKAVKVPLGAERVDAVPVDRRRAARAGRVGNSNGAGVLEGPEHLTRLFIEAEHSLLAGERLAGKVVDLDVFLRHKIAYVHLAASNRGASVAVGDRRAPHDLGSPGGEFFQ